MLENVSGESIATEVEMIRSAFQGTVVILEGNNDSSLFDNFFDAESSHILVAHGKENALSAIEIINNCEEKGVLAIVDADFWRIEDIPDLPDNILVTDKHDTEGMIFSSSAFFRVASEYCSARKTQICDDLRDFFYEKTKIIGLLRYTSKRHTLNLVFHDLDYKKFTNKDSLEIVVPQLIRYIQSLTRINAKKHGGQEEFYTDETVLEHLNGIIEEGGNYDSSEICCGHDLISLFGLGLRKLFATLKASVADKDNVRKLFRLAFSINDFVNTNLYAAIVQWEQVNVPYKILKNNIILEPGAAH